MKRIIQNTTKFGKAHFLFLLIFAFAAFLRLYLIDHNFLFTAEVGDNLLDIKNAFIHRQIPLKGPPTSHPWLAFGPLFYWLYGPVLIASQFNPLSHAYFAACISLLLLVANYYFIQKLFSYKTALFSSFLIAISPLYVTFTRTGRFTFIVSFLIYPFLWMVHQIPKGKTRYYFWSAFLLGCMINFHYTSLIFIPFLITYFYVNHIKLAMKHIFLGIAGFFLPLSPLLTYDGMHGFMMSRNLLLWIPYRILGFLGMYHKNSFTSQVFHENTVSYLSFFSYSFTPTLDNSYTIFGLIIFILIITFLLWKCRIFIQKRTIPKNWLLLLLWGLWGFLAIFIHGNVPMHYYVPLLPLPIILFSLFLERILMNRFGIYIVLTILSILIILNVKYYFFTPWFYSNENAPFTYNTTQRIAHFISNDAKGKPFKLNRIGYNDIYEKQFAQNYIYLLWLYKNEPVEHANVTYTIIEDFRRIPTPLKKSTIHSINTIIIAKKLSS